MAYALDYFNSIAQDTLEYAANNIAEKNVLLYYLTGRAGASQKDGRPGATTRLNGRAKNLPKAVQRSLAGSTYWEPVVVTQDQGGGGGVSYREAVGDVSELDILGAMKFAWTMFSVPAKVMKDDLDTTAGNNNATMDLLKTHLQVCMNRLEQLINLSLFTGNPTQTTKQWNAFLGLVSGLAATGNYGNVDKAVETVLKPSFVSTSAENFSWNMIDRINQGGTNPNGGAATLGTGIDLVIVNHDLFTDTIRPLAIADGKDVISMSRMAEIGMVGFERDVVKYGDVLITYDPACPTGTSAAKSYLFGLTTKSWRFITHPQYDFKWSGWTDLEAVTGERAVRGYAQLKAIFGTPSPALNGMFTAVN